jgi:large subunit ribosomal protein L35
LPKWFHKIFACANTPVGFYPKSFIMPKVKTHSRAKKTFKVTGTGKISFRKTYRGHLLTKKSKSRKRNLRVEGVVPKSNVDFVKRLLRLK